MPTSKPQPDGTLAKALARAWRWQCMLDDGEYATLAELADAERISRSHISRVLRLTLLAPGVIERILYGRPAPRLPQLLKEFSGRVGDAAAATPLSGLDDARPEWEPRAG